MPVNESADQTEKSQVRNVGECRLPAGCEKTPPVSRATWKQRLQTIFKNAPGNICHSTTIVDFILRRKHTVTSHDGRRIPLSIEHSEPLTDARRGRAYISNSVRTSRYTLWDFIPKQLFFQFTRVGNFYFLCVGVPQM
ncbi:hypothetical protein E4U43_006713, partial [Claviceps pusilla]